MFEEKLYHKKMNPQKLKDYGFTKNGAAYEYRTSILEGSFALLITISQDGAIGTRLVEQPSGEEYVLYKTDAAGSFVGKVRCAIGDVIEDIAQRCFDTAVFTEDDFTAAKILTDFACASIKNVYSFQEIVEHSDLTKEAEMAGKIQLTLHPKLLPSIPGLSLGSYFNTSEGVCGDAAVCR